MEFLLGISDDDRKLIKNNKRDMLDGIDQHSVDLDKYTACLTVVYHFLNRILILIDNQRIVDENISSVKVAMSFVEYESLKCVLNTANCALAPEKKTEQPIVIDYTVLEIKSVLDKILLLAENDHILDWDVGLMDDYYYAFHEMEELDE